MTKIIFRDLQKHFDWDLRANPINSYYTENFEVLLKKNEKLMILMLIFSYEAIKYQKVYVYIMKGLSFDFPKNTIAFTSDS